jgi:hypothetical protein
MWTDVFNTASAGKAVGAIPFGSFGIEFCLAVITRYYVFHLTPDLALYC